jgi:hypothetical protein
MHNNFNQVSQLLNLASELFQTHSRVCAALGKEFNPEEVAQISDLLAQANTLSQSAGLPIAITLEKVQKQYAPSVQIERVVVSEVKLENKTPVMPVKHREAPNFKSLGKKAVAPTSIDFATDFANFVNREAEKEEFYSVLNRVGLSSHLPRLSQEQLELLTDLEQEDYCEHDEYCHEFSSEEEVQAENEQADRSLDYYKAYEHYLDAPPYGA